MLQQLYKVMANRQEMEDLQKRDGIEQPEVQVTQEPEAIQENNDVAKDSVSLPDTLVLLFLPNYLSPLPSSAPNQAP